MPFSLYLLALAVFVMGTSEFMLAGLLPAIASDLDVSVGTAGLLTSAFAVGMVVGAPLMAAFARRWPPRLTLVVCLLVFAGCHVVGALTPTFSVLLVTRVLSALANAGFLAVALTTATSLVPRPEGTRPRGAALGHDDRHRRRRARRRAVRHRARVAIDLLGDRHPLRARGGRSAARHPDDQTADGRRRHGFGGARTAGTPRLILAMALGALINGGTFAAFTFLAPVVTEVAGLDAGWVSVALVLFGIGSFLGVTIAGRLSDRHPGLVLAVGGPLLLAGWIAMALVASHRCASPWSSSRGFVVRRRQHAHRAGAVRGIRSSDDGRVVRTRRVEYRDRHGHGLGAVGLATSAGLLAPVGRRRR